MEACNITLLDVDWPDEAVIERGLFEIDFEVWADLKERARQAAEGRFPWVEGNLPRVGSTDEIAKRFGMAEDSYGASLGRLRAAGLISVKVLEVQE